MNLKRLILLSLAIVVITALMVVAAPAQRANAATCSLQYTVQRGNTLYGIARMFGTTVADLQSINGMAAETRIWAGQKLCIRLDYSDTPMTTYTVQRGDTLYSISRRTLVSVDVLMRINHITNPNRIYVGQVLLIPTYSS
ncbi:MAG: LysM peptidoglycan-binding domain-containing protein [Anaerolineae bacterium]|nr:LysM peptidoglycan-binding domain-containing protein [Anaerolineae bacterium]